MKANVTIQGTVTLPNGSPAARILLQAEGNRSPDYFRGYARTTDDGTYALSVHADQAYAVGVIDDDWGTRSHVGEDVREGDQPHRVDLKLVRGSLIEGVLTTGSDRRPAVGEGVALNQVPDRATQPPQFIRRATTDEWGHYRFRVGPGNYQLSLPMDMALTRIHLNVKDQASIVQNGHADRRMNGLLQGRTVQAEDGRPLAGTSISGETIGQPFHAQFHVVSDGAGQFKTEWRRDQMFVLAQYCDRSGGLRSGQPR